MAANNYQVNYEDERFQQVEADKKEAMTEVEQTYAGMINSSDQYYNAQIEASKDWANTQSQLQQEQTDFTIEQIEQQKDKANKDYLKEQSGAYVDWQKQSNQYGVNAEAKAAGGLTGTGYSESSQVSMYNTYQNRVATARESYNNAVLNYNNAIKDARLQNNAALAEIAYTALQQQLELSLQGFQYKNQLILDQTNKKIELDNMYYQRYQDVLNQINTENAMAEEIRQYEKNFAEQQRQYNQNFAEEVRQHNQNYQLSVKQFNEEVRQYNQDYQEKVRQFNEEIKRLKDKDAKEYALEIKNLELKKQQLAEEKRQFDAQMKQKEASLFDNQMKQKEASLFDNQSYAVNTEYYRGALNADAKTYGTFSNGYQPKGIKGHGKVTKTNDYVTFNTTNLSGEKKTVRQNVWKAEDGTLWYWEGRQNKYLPFTSTGLPNYTGSKTGAGGGSGIKPTMKAIK